MRFMRFVAAVLICVAMCGCPVDHTTPTPPAPSPLPSPVPVPTPAPNPSPVPIPPTPDVVTTLIEQQQAHDAMLKVAAGMAGAMDEIIAKIDQSGSITTADMNAIIKARSKTALDSSFTPVYQSMNASVRADGSCGPESRKLFDSIRQGFRSVK